MQTWKVLTFVMMKYGRPNMAEKSKMGKFLKFQIQTIRYLGDLPKVWLYITKIMIKGFVLFHQAILHGHVAMKNGGFNMAKKENEQIFRFFNNDCQLMVGAAKIVLFLVKVRMQESSVFNMFLLHNHVAMKNGRFNMAERLK